MKKINVNEIASLNGSELLEIRLKNGKRVSGFISSTSTSHSSFFSQSNGILDYLVIKPEVNSNVKHQDEVLDNMIIGNEIDEVFLISAPGDYPNG
jgi:hypothetical protein